MWSIGAIAGSISNLNNSSYVNRRRKPLKPGRQSTWDIKPEDRDEELQKIVLWERKE